MFYARIIWKTSWQKKIKKNPGALDFLKKSVGIFRHVLHHRVSRAVQCIKETTLERADLTIQLLMFVTAEKEREIFLIFFHSSFCQLLSLNFKLG